MTTRSNNEEQSETAHGQSLAHKLALYLLCPVAILAACSDVEPLNLPPLDPNDVDADDVRNEVDNCPDRYNPDQHDEDHDGFGDACDVCPTVFDDQADTGETGAFGFGDHIGDACDPRPSRDGDSLTRIDTFSSIDTYANWDGGGWQIAADVATAISEARWHDPRRLDGDGLLAQIHVPLLVWLGAGRLEVAVNGDGATDGALCAIEHGDDGDVLIARELAGQELRTPLEVEAPFTLTAWRVIGPDRKAELRCLVDDLRIELPMFDEIPAGTYAFAASGALVDVDSIAVYTFPINPCFQVPPTDGPPHLRACDGNNF